MGDHRATVSIKFTFHGKTYEIKDAWWNWSWQDSECDGVDQRVIDFFRRATNEGVAAYEEQREERYAREHAAELEASERRELERLKAKYEG